MSIEEGITIKKLEVFLSFMNFGNMARVAESMGQSSVSIHRSLHSLEEAVRCPLFKRQGRNLIPLIAAYTFAEYARKILLACEEGLAKTREVGGFNAAKLKIGSLYSLTVTAIPQLLVGMKLRRPDLEINLSLGSNRELLQSLEDGRFDAIVVALGTDTKIEGMISLPLFYDSMYFAAPIDSPYARTELIDLKKLQHEHFITLGDGFATSRDFAFAFEQAGYSPDLVMQVDDIFSLINLVSGGVGYSLLPKRIEAFSPRIHLIPMEPRYVGRQLIAVLIPENRERDPNLLALAAECRMFSSRSKNSVAVSA